MLRPIRRPLVQTFQRSLAAAQAVIFVLLLTPLSLPAQDAETVDYRDYERALASFEEQDHAASIIHLKNMLQKQPGHLPSRVLMAENYLAKRQPLLAESELDYARSAGADLDRIAPLLTRCYNMMRRFDETLNITRPARRPASLEAELAVARGTAYIGLDQLNEARQSFEYAARKAPTSEAAQIGLLRTEMLGRQYQAAADRADKLLSANPELTATWITRAKLYSIKGDNAGALQAINRALELEPDNDAARLARATFYMDQEDYEAAEADIDLILENYPLEPRSSYLKAVITSNRGERADTMESLDNIAQTLLALDEGVMEANPDYYFIAAVTNNKLGNQDLARQFIRQYEQLVNDDLSALRLRAIIELQSGVPLSARNAMLKANKIAPNNPNNLSLLGRAYLGLKEYHAAYRSFSRIEEIAPGTVGNLANLARAQLGMGYHYKAIEYLHRAEAIDPDSAEVQLLLIDSFQRAYQIDNAIKQSAALLEKSPNNPQYLQVHAESLGLAGRIEESITLFEGALQRQPSNRVTTVFLSRIDLGLGRSDAALQRLVKFREDYGDSEELLIEIADTYAFIDDSEQAIYWLNKALDLEATSEAAMLRLARLHTELGDRDTAIELSRRFLRRVAESSAVHELLAELYLQEQLHDDALRHYTLAVKHSRYQPESLVKKASAQLSISDIAGARYSLNRAVALDENYLPPRIELTRIAITLGEFDEARQLIAAIKELAPDKPTADLLQGDLDNRLGRFAAAEAAYRKALEFGDVKPAIMGLYSVHSRSNRLAAVIPELEAWIEKYPEDIGVALATAAAHQALKNFDRAEAIYEGLLQIQPDSVVILNNAANMYLEKDDHAKAYQYANRARELAPGNATIIDTVAWIELNRGNFEEALQLLRKARVMDVDNPEIKYHLAITLDQLDRRSEAIRVLREAVKSPRGFGDKAKAEQLLQDWTAGASS